MFTISRFEQFVKYFWTGSNWSTVTADAKEFDTESAAHAEIETKKVVFVYNVNRI